MSVNLLVQEIWFQNLSRFISYQFIILILLINVVFWAFMNIEFFPRQYLNLSMFALIAFHINSLIQVILVLKYDITTFTYNKTLLLNVILDNNTKYIW